MVIHFSKLFTRNEHTIRWDDPGRFPNWDYQTLTKWEIHLINEVIKNSYRCEFYPLWGQKQTQIHNDTNMAKSGIYGFHC